MKRIEILRDDLTASLMKILELNNDNYSLYVATDGSLWLGHNSGKYGIKWKKLLDADEILSLNPEYANFNHIELVSLIINHSEVIPDVIVDGDNEYNVVIV